MSILLFFLLGFSVDHDSTWQAANQAYQDGNYSEAVTQYESLIEAGIHNGKLHYNLGNAYFKTGKLGKAIVHYHRARKFLPGDADIEANLTMATQTRVDPIIDDEDESFQMGFENFVHKLNYQTIFFLGIFFLAVGGLTSLLLVVRPHSGKWAGYVLVIGLLTGLFFTAATYVQYNQLTRKDMAVILAKKVDVLSGPSTRETVSFTIHEGITCRILDKTEGWVRIRLANGYNGWVKKLDLEVI